MDIPRKIEIAQQSLASITGHHDVDAAVRIAALEHLKGQCDAAIATVQAELADKIAAAGIDVVAA